MAFNFHYLPQYTSLYHVFFRYDALLRQHHTLQESIHKRRSPSYSADSLDGEHPGSVPEILAHTKQPTTQVNYILFTGLVRLNYNGQ